jgi:hypothetical protein
MVDLENGTVTLHETKNWGKRIVPLSSEVFWILSGLARRIDGKLWGITSHTVAVAFRSAVSWARAAYERECQENGSEPDPPSWWISPFTISGHQPVL